MKPENDHFEENMKLLEPVFEKMAKAGFIVRQAHSDKTKRVVTEFSQHGINLVRVIYSANQTLGPLTGC